MSGRLVHDFGVLFVGAPAFKLLRLTLCVLLVLHVLACGYYRVKVESSPPEVVDQFFESRGVDPQARCGSLIHSCHTAEWLANPALCWIILTRVLFAPADNRIWPKSM